MGLPADTNLYFHPRMGTLAGLPGAVDLAKSHVLTITARDKQGDTASSIFMLQFAVHDHGSNTGPGSSTYGNKAPVGLPVPEQYFQLGQSVIVDLSKYLNDAEGEPLSYIIKDGPSDSGLHVDSGSGVLYGAPTSDDARQSPVRLMVEATDNKGATGTILVVVYVGGKYGPSPLSKAKGARDANKGDCCGLNDLPGCSDRRVEACVCGYDPYCCESTWDSDCLNIADDQNKCNACGPGSGGADFAPFFGGVAPFQSPALANSCCSASGLTGGCQDVTVSECVCKVDYFCCTKAWDQTCVDIAQTACMSLCP
jgi:hypothetical protein